MRVETHAVVEAVGRRAEARADWSSASDLAPTLGVSVASMAHALRRAAKANLIEAAEPSLDHPHWQYRPLGHVPRSPRSRDDWRRVIDSTPSLDEQDRRVLEVAEIEGVKPPGIYRTGNWMAAQLGLSRAGFEYRWWRAVAKLGWRVPERRRTPTALRRELVSLAVAARAPCGLCGHPIVVAERVALDHIVEVRHGGSDEPSNLRVVHWICNLAREHRPKHPTIEQMTLRRLVSTMRGSPTGAGKDRDSARQEIYRE